ncbi:MAG: 50S ribosomal protein L32 [Elusimicrobia bacterium RIFOXYB2_FULL_49_7]|nr:MAG: 50S ribosomal protein L32 [Elusimicrobia bacterium RIFOXYB2_FULL_49_7]
MPVPKRKHSHAHTCARRASNFKLKDKTVTKCGHCTQPIVPHRICPHCGYYGGVEVIQVSED